MAIYYGVTGEGNIGKWNEVITGIKVDWSQATVDNESQILEGKSCYGKDGVLYRGNLAPITTTFFKKNSTINTGYNSTGVPSWIILESNFTEQELSAKDRPISLAAPLIGLGDATADDVANGVTFSSKKGINIIGTNESTKYKYYDFSDNDWKNDETADTFSFIVSNATTITTIKAAYIIFGNDPAHDWEETHFIYNSKKPTEFTVLDVYDRSGANANSDPFSLQGNKIVFNWSWLTSAIADYSIKAGFIYYE